MLTIEVAAELGWKVYQAGNGGWGIPETSTVWYCKPASWPINSKPAKQWTSAEAALAEVERRLAHDLGVSIPDFRGHLAAILVTR